MKDTCPNLRRRSNAGFSLIELLTAVVVILILGALAVPAMMSYVYGLKIRYSATDLSGLLQRTRMEAVRKNTFYSVQNAGGAPVMLQVVDKNAAVVASVPPAVLGGDVNAVFGTGSGAPGEAAFVAALNFPGGVAAAAAGSPSFNARGLPCIATGAPTCTLTPGQGFVFFLSGTSGAGGTVGWSAVAVTPSGRCQVWAYDGANWTQQ